MSFVAVPPNTNYFVPSDISQFDCFAVTVLGPDIQAAPACGGQTQMGITAGFIGRTGVLELNVPFGKGRTFQVWGFARSHYCPDVTEMLTTAYGEIPPGLNSTGFLLGQAKADTNDLNVTVNIPVAFTFGVNPIICGSVPPPVTAIDSVVMDTVTPPWAGLALNNNDITSGAFPVCVNFSTTAHSPVFTVYEDGVNIGAPVTGGCPPYSAGYVHKFQTAVPTGFHSHSISIKTVDKIYGLSALSPPSFSWTVDTIAPVLSIQQILPGQFDPIINANATNELNPSAILHITKAGTVQVNWARTVPAGPTTLPVNCAIPSTPGTFSCTITPVFDTSTGTYTVTFSGHDYLGIGANAVSTSIVMDQAPPTLSLAPTGGWIQGGDFASGPTLMWSDVYSGDVNTNTLACLLDLQATSCNSINFNVNSITMRGGRHDISANVSDYAGNPAVTLSQHVWVDNLVGQTVLGRVNPDGTSIGDESTSSAVIGELPGAGGLFSNLYSAFDAASGYLFTPDAGNHRVLVYKWDFNKQAVASARAVAVYGQYDFADEGSGTAVVTKNGVSYARMYLPTAVEIATGVNGKKLFVSDAGNNRVLRFDLSTAPLGNGLDVSTLPINKQPDLVIGQANLTGNLINRTGNPSTSGSAQSNQGLNFPAGIVVVNKRLYVADFNNCRVAVWHNVVDAAASSGDFGAVDTQIGAGGAAPTSTWSCPAGTASNSLNHPLSIAAQSGAINTIWIADSLNHRVVSVPNVDSVTFSTSFDSSSIYGQPDNVTTTGANGQTGSTASQSSVAAPYGVAFVTDGGGNNYIAVGDVGTGALPKVKFFDNNSNHSSTYRGIVHTWGGPPGTGRGAFISSPTLLYNATAQSLFVGDTNASRVGIFSTVHITENQQMLDVLGHTDITGTSRSFHATAPKGTTENNMFRPTATVADIIFHRLYVADSGNNRVLVYNIDPGTYQPATLASAVIGVPSFADGHPMQDASTNALATASNTLNTPTALALDGSRRLWVADTGNNRVIRFPTNVATLPLSATADLVLGQADTSSNLAGATSAKMNAPAGLAYDYVLDRLFVADRNNARVLAFALDNATTGMQAFDQLGQTGMPAVTSSQFMGPGAMTFTAGTAVIPMGLFITDVGTHAPMNIISDLSTAHRVMYFDISTSTTTSLPNKNAGACYGHHDVTGPFPVTSLTNVATNSCRLFSQNDGDGATLGAKGTYSLNAPFGVAFGQNNVLYVADTGNHRVVAYDLSSSINQPLSSNNATIFDVSTLSANFHVIGSRNQISVVDTNTNPYSTSVPMPTGNLLSFPTGMQFLPAPNGKNLLFVPDFRWHRVGVYEVP
jgi:hypothetical protein